MFEELLSSFLKSQQGQQASSILQQQHGMSEDDANNTLTHAVPVAASTLREQTEGQGNQAGGAFSILGGHAGSSFLMGAIAGLARGESLGDAMKDGVAGVVAGRIAEVISEKLGLPQAQASQIAAVIAPMLLKHAHEKLGEHPEVQAQHGAPPAAPGLDLGGLLGGLLGGR